MKLEAAAKSWAAAAERREQLDADLRRAGQHNHDVAAADQQMKRRDQVVADVAKLKEDSEACTKALKTIELRKAEILAAAKLPVEGLSIGDDGIELAGVPFSQASASERLRELIAKHAAAAGKRVWIERVGTRDPGVIEIRDGEVVASKGKRKPDADRAEV